MLEKADTNMQAKVFMRAAELIDQGHCKLAPARTTEGRAVLPQSPHAVSWCLTGSLELALSELSGERLPDSQRPFLPQWIWSALVKAHGTNIHFVLWNNAPERKPEEVSALLRNAGCVLMS